MSGNKICIKTPLKYWTCQNKASLIEKTIKNIYALNNSFKMQKAKIDGTKKRNKQS